MTTKPSSTVPSRESPTALGRLGLAIALGALVVTGACEPAAESPERIVDSAIERHGGDLFENSLIRFDFRGDDYEVIQDGGAFSYRRSYTDDTGRTIVEGMDNDGTWREVDGQPVPLDADARAEVELTVNSTIYFQFLPFRLRDPAVQLRRLESTVVSGEPYEKIEVTFLEEGGGEDWEDRFLYWFHQDDHTLDYMAYRYDRGGGGTRFRRAVNRREVGGLLLQDYENYTADPEVDDIADYDRLWEAGAVDFLSMIEIDAVEVERLDGAGRESEPLADDPGEGLEVQLGIDRPSYAPGEEVRALLRLVNRAAETLTLEFSSAQRYDLVLLTSDEEEVARWSADQMFAQVLGEERLEPGETLEFEELFAAPDAPGSYHLQGVISAREADLWARVPLQVSAP